MNTWTFAKKSFLHNWQVNSAVILGAAIATAVLTGALIVGDSVRGSLLDLTIERLGKIDEIILADRFFREELANEVQSATTFQAYYRYALPAIVLPTVSAEYISETGTARASSVTLVGCDPRFWEQDPRSVDVDHAIDDGSIVVNQPLADQLGVNVGDSLTVRLPKVQNMAADSTLADKSDVSETMAGLRVTRIIPASGLGRFSLNPSQHLPLCAFVSLTTAQDAVNQNGQINSILACSDRVDEPPPPEAHANLRESLRPTLEDVGLTLKAIELDYFDEKTEAQKLEHRYVSLSTDRMMFIDSASDAIKSRLKNVIVQPVFTYLANSIATIDGSVDIPYSTITAIDSLQTIGPLLDQTGTPLLAQLADDEIVLNDWAAFDLSVSLGDSITVRYFDPETTHGEPTEHSATFRVAAIAPLVKPLLPYSRRQAAKYVDPPAWTNDPDLTPTVPGVTDQASIDDWDPPFPFDYKRIQVRKPRDDDYWESYRTTPKAFVSFATGKRLWASRFGSVTSFRIDADSTSVAQLQDQVKSAVADNVGAFGFQVIESKRIGIDAAKGTTPFNVLFMAFSFFIVTAAVLLLALLFRLSVEQRASENGLLLSVGLGNRTVGKLILLEGLFVALVAALIGLVLGIAYATLMITGLKTWWVDAVVTPFLNIHITYMSLLTGALLGILTTCFTILVTLWGLRKVPARQLLAGDVELHSPQQRNHGRWTGYLPIALAIVAVACGLLGMFLSGEAQAGAFFGTGASILAAGLLLVRSLFSTSGRVVSATVPIKFNDRTLAFRNAARNPSRSVMTIGLMSAACFLVIAISAFRLAPSDEGSGGFSLVASSELPIFDDLNDADVRSRLFGNAAEKIAHSTILCLRLRDGEDASCRNLYQTQRPRLIGVTSAMIEHFHQAKSSFKFAGSVTDESNPWTVLAEETTAGEAIPVVLDKNTAMYSQHLYGGIGEEFERDYGGGQVIRFRVAGLLANSVLQGSFLIGEADLRRLFPNVGGYRYFLIQSENPVSAQQLLEDTFQNEGFDATDSRDLLRDLLAVQNTYLSTFQSLGGLGLLLGTFGLMAVQLRNVWQRRGEIALLRATGFDQSRVGRVIMLEHALLLFSGLGLGTVAAMLTVLPHILIGGATVPLLATAYMLALIVAVGFVTGFVAVRSSSRLPLLATLRGM